MLTRLSSHASSMSVRCHTESHTREKLKRFELRFSWQRGQSEKF